ncbi:MAG: DUF72 domain-containing protein [Bacteroidales bacterium]|nr:DUF72 domain-containing protein [Bacteroidales bacterium]
MTANHKKYYIGTSGWSYNHWKGNFYPEDIKKNNWFDYYTGHFSTVEINATFYRKFKDETFTRWKDKSPDNFSFVLKIPRFITHIKKLVNVKTEISEFCRQAMLLQDKLGCLLLQLPPFISYQRGLLYETLGLFKKGIRVAVEFRNRTWLINESKEILKRHSAIFCNSDSPVSALNDWITTDTAYLRMHGRTSWYAYNYTNEELMNVAVLMNRFFQNGIKTIYVFFNNDYGGFAPQNARILNDILSSDISLTER